MPSTFRQPASADRIPSRSLVPGLGVAVLVGAAAVLFGRSVPVVGAPVVALLLGIGLRGLLDRFGPRAAGRLRGGVGFAGRYLLQVAIVLFGAGLSVSTVWRVGSASLPVMLATLGVCLVAAWLFGRLLRIADPLRILIGVGTGICGASAIAAVSPVLAAEGAELAYAVSTIVTYNVLAVVLFPPIGHLLGLGPHAFGLWAGTAVNDTSSVVATADAYGAAVGQYAVVVKLTRSLMIVPVVLVLVFWTARRRGVAGTGAPDVPAGGGASRPAVWRLVPPFIVVFLAAAALNSIGVVPAGWHAATQVLAGDATAVAMAGVGLGTSVRALRGVGSLPLLFGGVLSALTAISSLAVQALSGGLR